MMPPSGFVRSSVFDLKLVTGNHKFITSIPNVICPFIVEIAFSVMSSDNLPSKISLPEDSFSLLFKGHDEQFYVLVNNNLFCMNGDGFLSLRTVPIDQNGGDIFIGVEGRGGKLFHLAGFYRTWGDPTLGNYGQKAKIADGHVSSTREGYFEGRANPDFVLTDEQLESLHLKTSLFTPKSFPNRSRLRILGE